MHAKRLGQGQVDGHDHAAEGRRVPDRQRHDGFGRETGLPEDEEREVEKRDEQEGVDVGHRPADDGGLSVVKFSVSMRATRECKPRSNLRPDKVEQYEAANAKIRASPVNLAVGIHRLLLTRDDQCEEAKDDGAQDCPGSPVCQFPCAGPSYKPTLENQSNLQEKVQPPPRRELSEQTCRGTPTASTNRRHGTEQRNRYVPHPSRRECDRQQGQRVRHHERTPDPRQSPGRRDRRNISHKAANQLEQNPPQACGAQHPLVAPHSAEAPADEHEGALRQAAARVLVSWSAVPAV